MSEENKQESTETTENKVVEEKKVETPAISAEDYAALKKAHEDAIKELKGFKNKARDAEKEKISATTDVEELRKHYEGELGSRDERFNGLVNTLVQKEVSLNINEALGEAKGSVKLLAPHIQTRVKGEFQDDGTTKITVLNEDGTPMYVKGKPGTIKDLVAQLKSSDDFAAAFEGSGATGTGSQAPLNNKGTTIGEKNPWSKDSWNITEQMRLSVTDPVKAQQLKAAATK